MNSDEIDAYPVLGLGVGIQEKTIGYLVFCKTRKLNETFYEWMMEEVLVPFVKKII
jgi:hypothetical protein